MYSETRLNANISNAIEHLLRDFAHHTWHGTEQIEPRHLLDRSEGRWFTIENRETKLTLNFWYGKKLSKSDFEKLCFSGATSDTMKGHVTITFEFLENGSQNYYVWIGSTTNTGPTTCKTLDEIRHVLEEELAYNRIHHTD